MKVEKDFIKREIEKISLMLTILIEKVSGLNSSNAKSGIEEVNEFLKSEFDFTLQGLTEMEDSEFLNHIEKLHESHLEKLIELMFEIAVNKELNNVNEDYNKIKIAHKVILLIDFLDKKTSVYSMKRMNIKNELEQIA